MNEAQTIEPELSPQQRAAITRRNNQALKAAQEEDKPVTNTYKNTTRNNIFTEAGKCGPNKTISLLADDAGKYAGLELCSE